MSVIWCHRYRNFNFAFTSTHGELFKWAAHDDVCSRRLLERCIERLDRSPGAVLCHACLPVEEFGEAWPVKVPVQIHGMEADPFFVDEGDLDAQRQGDQLFVVDQQDAE